MKLKIWIFLFVFAHTIQAQNPVSGVVHSIVNDQVVENVRISSLDQSVETFSNKDGSFLLSRLDVENFGFVLDKKQLTWAGNQTIWSFLLIDIQGGILLNNSFTQKSGKVDLPVEQYGIYLLKVSYQNNFETYKIYFDGNQIQSLLVDISGENIDTLILEKDGYKTQKSPSSKITHYLEPNNYSSSLDYMTFLPNYTAFKTLQSSPRKTNIGEVETIKVLYNFKEDKIFFAQSKKYEYHYQLASAKLGYSRSHSHFNNTQYSINPDRIYYNFTLNYYKSQNLYTMDFFGGDQITCEQMALCYEKLKNSSYIKDNLFIFNNNPKLDNCKSAPFITGQVLYQGIHYQALSLEKSYGYLKKIDFRNIDNSYLGKRDLILINGVPNDLPVVSGIITTQFQTPLSHINVLSNNRKTPNMALTTAWNDESINSLLGNLVYLEVRSDSFILRKASLEEATKFWKEKEPSKPIILSVDSSDKTLVDFSKINTDAVNRVGGKAANFSVLYNDPEIPNPENAFAIPVTFYLRHLKNNNIDLLIENLLQDSAFYANQEVRKEKLKIIQNLIKNAPLDTFLVRLVKDKIQNFALYDNYKFRSSTNAEDLEFFSGAGLYDSYSAIKDDPNKTIEEAIKKVWASAWNFRAFEEREYYKIDQKNVAMGILVHRSFSNELANGVVITQNLYNTNDGIIINAQYGESSIVYPETGVLNDEIMVIYYPDLNGSSVTTEYLSRSNILPANQSTVLTNKEIEAIAVICRNLEYHYFYLEPNSCNCTFKEFALDIEFKIDLVDGKRKLYVKQVRPYR